VLQGYTKEVRPGYVDKGAFVGNFDTDPPGFHQGKAPGVAQCAPKRAWNIFDSRRNKGLALYDKPVINYSRIR
jgi:hypothetical protein